MSPRTALPASFHLLASALRLIAADAPNIDSHGHRLGSALLALL